MTPEMIAALSANRKSVTGFFEIDLPSGTRRMLIGSGEVAWSGNTFKGFDSSFGTIIGGDTVAEDVSGQAPNTSLTIQVASTADKSELAGGDVQLSPVNIWLAAIQLDGSNHFEAVPDPELMFFGFIDQAVINLDKKKDEIDYTIISAFDYFFEDSEGQRLSAAFHHLIWSSATLEKGLDNVTGVTRKIYWGTLGPNAAGNVTGGGSGTGGGTIGAGCVTDDTPVLMADGSEKPAGELRVGDVLRTRHETTLEWGDYPITAFATMKRPVYRAMIDGRELRATADHPAWLDGRWQLMGDLGQPDGEATIVKLTVADAHTYIANGVLSHNKSEYPSPYV